MEIVREIWFRCADCGRESYCEGSFDRLPDPDVMCPFCHSQQKLKDTRIS